MVSLSIFNWNPLVEVWIGHLVDLIKDAGCSGLCLFHAGRKGLWAVFLLWAG